MRHLSRRQLAFDVVLAVVFTAVCVTQVFVDTFDGYLGGPQWLNLVLAVLTGLPLAARRIRPVAVACSMFAVHLLPNLFVAHNITFWGTGLALAVATFSAGRYGRAQHAPWLFGLALAFFATYGIHMPEFRGWDDVLFPVLLTVAAWVAGRTIGRITAERRALDAALRELAEAQADRERQVVLEERARIAREMHDVVAHGVSVMVVQAGAARAQLPAGADGSREAVLAVERSGREVLGELRRTISLLREPEAGQEGVTEPVPGLADLPDLVESMRRAGLDVRLHLGEVPSLDAGRALAVYRVVQEALTNTLKHVGPTRVDVAVAAEAQPAGLVISVTDEGARAARQPAASGRGGNGLVGMRERVEMFGGQLSAGPRAGGFEVRAAIPLEVAG